MPPHKIIADSDDEEEEGSPLSSPAASPQPAKEPKDASPSNTHSGLDSTDSQYFRTIYSEQQDTIGEDGQRGIGEEQADVSVDTSSSVQTTQAHGKPNDTEGTSSLTSITDLGRVSKSTKKTRAKSLANLTEITTPGRQATQGRRSNNSISAAIWDVPNSPEQPRSSVGKKRSSAAPRRATDNRIALPIITEETTMNKRRRIESHSRTSEVSEEATQPFPSGFRADEPAQGVLPPLEEPDIVDLVVEPSPLPSSVRDQYQEIHTSSVDQGPAYPLTRQIYQNAMAEHSSGSATIAYGTPTEYAGSMMEPDPLGEPAKPSSGDYKGRLKGAVEPQSSPDVICIGDEPGPGVEITEEASRPDGSALGSLPDTQLPPPTKKRGRPKKADSHVQQDEEHKTGGPLQQPGLLATLSEDPKGKKKRGRPRKADKAVELVTGGESTEGTPSHQNSTPDDEAHSASHVADDQQHSNAAQVEEGGQLTSRENSVQTHHHAPEQAPSHEETASLVKEPATPAATELNSRLPARTPAEQKLSSDALLSSGARKSASPLTTNPPSASKPIYRVGLSKRSRIAPLLKSLRK